MENLAAKTWMDTDYGCLRIKDQTYCSLSVLRIIPSIIIKLAVAAIKRQFAHTTRHNPAGCGRYFVNGIIVIRMLRYIVQELFIYVGRFT